MKIAIVGAGGFVFPLRLVGDILSFSELQAAELALMDINPETLARTADAARELARHHQLAARVTETTSRRDALSATTRFHQDERWAKLGRCEPFECLPKQASS